MRGSALVAAFLRSSRIVDAIGGRQRIDIVVIQVEVGFDGAELIRFRDSRKRIFRSDARQAQRRLHHLIDTAG